MPIRTPLRTCVACRERRAQRDLIRLSSGPESGAVRLRYFPGVAPGLPSHPTGGRSVYLCPSSLNPGCRERVKPAALARTLRAPVSPESLASLLRTLPDPN